MGRKRYAVCGSRPTDDGMDHKIRVGLYIQKLVETNNRRPELTAEKAEVLIVQCECLLACLRGFIIIEELKNRAAEMMKG